MRISIIIINKNIKCKIILKSLIEYFKYIIYELKKFNKTNYELILLGFNK